MAPYRSKEWVPEEPRIVAEGADNGSQKESKIVEKGAKNGSITILLLLK